MFPRQKAPNKPLFNEEQGKIFLDLLDDNIDKRVAKFLFLDGLTCQECAEILKYSTRQIERKRSEILKRGILRLINKVLSNKEFICPMYCKKEEKNDESLL